jgi:hypothetical protein
MTKYKALKSENPFLIVFKKPTAKNNLRIAMPFENRISS